MFHRRLRLLLQLFDDGHDDPAIALLRRLFHLGVVNRFGGIDVLLEEIADALHPFLLFGRIIEIHRSSSWAERPLFGIAVGGL